LVRRLSPNRSDVNDILIDMINNAEIADAQLPEGQATVRGRLNVGQWLSVPGPHIGLMGELLINRLDDPPTIKDPNALELR
jgi:hypothetical protein